MEDKKKLLHSREIYITLVDIFHVYDACGKIAVTFVGNFNYYSHEKFYYTSGNYYTRWIFCYTFITFADQRSRAYSGQTRNEEDEQLSLTN